MAPYTPFLLTLVGALLIMTPIAAADPVPDLKALRVKVLKADKPQEKAKAYRAYFTSVGRAGLKDLMKDEDTGIALQAAWESNLKRAKRAKPSDYRTDDVYDSAELKKFFTFLKDRTKAPVPDWWAAGIVDVDVWPGQHHAFGTGQVGGPKLVKSKAGARVPEGARLEERGDDLVYAASGRSVRFPKKTLLVGLGDCITGLLGEKRSVLAGHDEGGGFAFPLVGFEGEGGKPAWTAEVWGASRGVIAGFAHHDVSLAEKDGTLFVFGGESHGMYLEAFDLATGKNKYRFCTCYWFNHSEEWDLK